MLENIKYHCDENSTLSVESNLIALKLESFQPHDKSILNSFDLRRYD